jgi:hypothetical protein
MQFGTISLLRSGELSATVWNEKRRTFRSEMCSSESFSVFRFELVSGRFPEVLRLYDRKMLPKMISFGFEDVIWGFKMANPD